MDLLHENGFIVQKSRIARRMGGRLQMHALIGIAWRFSVKRGCQVVFSSSTSSLTWVTFLNMLIGCRKPGEDVPARLRDFSPSLSQLSSNS
jgi:hypothetical protein